jgi:class 3 adenylate cyclase
MHEPGDVPRSRVRFSLRWKITLPFMLLALVLALILAILLSRVLAQGDVMLLARQLADRGQQAADAVVRAEISLLEVERLIANTEGVTRAVAGGDAEDLRARILPIVVNAGTDVVAVLDSQGTSLLALRRSPTSPPGEYSALRGETYYTEWPFVDRILGGEEDEEIGDKHTGLHAIRLEDRELFVLFVGGPIREGPGHPIGAVLVGSYLDSLVPRLSSEAGGNVSIYDPLSGRLLVSSLESPDPGSLAIPLDQVNAALGLTEGGAPVRGIEVSGTAYREVLLPFVARQETAVLGVLGVSLLEAPLQASGSDNLWTVVRFGAVALVLIVVTGLLISNSITRPLVEIADASAQVATGDLRARVRERGNDEIGLLARTFNSMVAGLREGVRYKEFLGQTMDSPTGDLTDSSIEAHATTATILVADLRGLAPPGAEADPGQILTTLQDYAAAVLPIMIQHGGAPGRFDGGVLTASFGILPKPLRPPLSALQAVHAALEMREHVASANTGRIPLGLPALSASIGVATGLVFAGGLEGPGGRGLTMVGEAVELAQGLQQLARETGQGGLLISDLTFRYLAGAQRQFEFGRTGVAPHRGLGRDVTIHEVLGRTQRLVQRTDT